MATPTNWPISSPVNLAFATTTINATSNTSILPSGTDFTVTPDIDSWLFLWLKITAECSVFAAGSRLQIGLTDGGATQTLWNWSPGAATAAAAFSSEWSYRRNLVAATTYTYNVIAKLNAAGSTYSVSGNGGIFGLLIPRLHL